MQHAEAKDKAKTWKKDSDKRVRVENGYQEQLIKKAKTDFQINDDITASRKTLEACISRDSLEVWQQGPKSLLLQSCIEGTCHLGLWSAPCSGHQWCNCICKWSHLWIELKRQVIVYTPGNDTLVTGWLRNFKQRNPDISLKGAQKYKQDWADFCNYSSSITEIL